MKEEGPCINSIFPLLVFLCLSEDNVIFFISFEILYKYGFYSYCTLNIIVIPTSLKHLYKYVIKIEDVILVVKKFEDIVTAIMIVSGHVIYRPLVCGFLPWFVPRALHVGFVLDEVILGRVFPFICHYYSIAAPHVVIYHLGAGGWKKDLLAAAFSQ